MPGTRNLIIAALVASTMMVGLSPRSAAAETGVVAAAEEQQLPDGIYDVYNGSTFVGWLIVSGGQGTFVPFDPGPIGGEQTVA